LVKSDPDGEYFTRSLALREAPAGSKSKVREQAFAGKPAPTKSEGNQPLTRITLVKPFVPAYSHVASVLVCR